MSVIETLEQYKNELNELKYQQAENPTQDRLDQINWLTNKIAEIEHEHGKQERITVAVTETAAAVDNMDIEGSSLRELIIDEEAYQFVKIAFQTMLNAKDAKYIDELAEIQAAHKDEIRAFGEREANLNFQLREKDKQLQTVIAENSELQAKVNTLEFERDEALKVRDNAATELEGYKLALEEKQKQIDTLRAEIAVGAKGAVQIDQTEQLKQAKEAFLASRIKVTGIRWEDELRKTHYLAEDMDGTTIRFGRLEKGKYLEVTAEEAGRFRAEREQVQSAEQAAPAAENHDVPSAPLVTGDVLVPELQFRPEEEATLPLHQPSDTGGVVQPTLEERVAILEKKVAELEIVCN